MTNRKPNSGVTEYRTVTRAIAAADDGKLSGRAAPFNSTTTIGGGSWAFRETIAPGAFKKSLNDGDVVLLDNHDSAKPLARKSAGTLDLAEGDKGLDWSATPADTSYARDVHANAMAKNYGGCSFGFEVMRDKWTVGDDGVDERELQEVKLHEISVCTFPAYGDTNVSARDQVSAGLEARERFYERTLRAKYDAEQLKSMLAKGQAFKNANGDPSYPIGDAEDLGNAIKAVGRGGSDHDAIRKYVMGRAKALGLSSKIPDNWASDGSISEQNAASNGDVEQRDDPDGKEYACIDGAVKSLSMDPPDVKGALASLKANQASRSATEADETREDTDTDADANKADADEMRKSMMRAAYAAASRAA